MRRNTALLQEIIGVLDSELDDTNYALDALESHFHDALLVNAGNVADVSSFATQLRLNITVEERFNVLDHMADQKMVGVNIDTVETAINELLGWDRFIEP